jgi:hypothetical protein
MPRLSGLRSACAFSGWQLPLPVVSIWRRASNTTRNRVEGCAQA